MLDLNFELQGRAPASITQQGRGASALEDPLRCETRDDPRFAADHRGNTREDDESGTMEIPSDRASLIVTSPLEKKNE